MNKILVTGAAGQLGTELTQKLCEIHGPEAVIASDINQNSSEKFSFCQFMMLDVMDKDSLRKAIANENISHRLLLFLAKKAQKKTPLKMLSRQPAPFTGFQRWQVKDGVNIITATTKWMCEALGFPDSLVTKQDLEVELPIML